MKEKEANKFSTSAKRGINKFSGLSSKEMIGYGEKYKRITGKNPNNINNKEHFYEWVSITRELKEVN